MHEANKKKVLHRVLLWILAYIVLVNIGDALGSTLGKGSLITALLLLGYLWILVRVHGSTDLMLSAPKKDSSAKVWYFLPLLALALIQWFAKLDPTLSHQTIVVTVLLMLGVGFIEEILFRALLFQAIEKASSTNRALVVSGITFGLGHVVNLLRGYSNEELLSQMVVAIVLGIVLALLVVNTRSILPGALFHVLFNIGGSLTKQDSDLQRLLLIPILVIAGIYAIAMFRLLCKRVSLSDSPDGKVIGSQVS
ncbi:MAG: lysostaphin resistance A-like protein [Sphaerochaeta sp.]